MSRLGVLAAALLLAGAAQATPNFDGVWMAISSPGALRTAAGKLPPLLPEARKIYDEHVAARKAGKPAFDGTAQCQPPSIPRAYIMGMPFEIQQESRYVTFMPQWNRLIRVVELNTTHEAQSQFAPYFFGWSVGRWDRDALLIDGILFDDSTVLDAAGLPHSTDMHLAERWAYEADGKTLRAEFTVDDAANYSAPWTTTLRFKRMPAGTEIQEDICLERLGLVKVK